MNSPEEVLPCNRCSEMAVVDAAFLEQSKSVFAELLVSLVVFCKQKRIDHTDLPVLQQVAVCIRTLESL